MQNYKTFGGESTDIDLNEKNICFSQKEYSEIKKGFHAEEMEDKWNLNFDENKLFCNRSWTGFLIYVVYFKEHDGKFYISKVSINRNKDEYTAIDDINDVNISIYLINRLLLNKSVEFPNKGNLNEPAIQIWSSVGPRGFLN